MEIQRRAKSLVLDAFRVSEAVLGSTDAAARLLAVHAGVIYTFGVYQSEQSEGGNG